MNFVQKVGGVVLVAGFGERFRRYEKGRHDTFFDNDLDWELIREHCNNFVAIQSDDDPGIELAQLELFKQKLAAKTVKVHGMGHFSTADGVYEVPIVRDELLGLVGDIK